MASVIDDEETVNLAVEWATKAEGQRAILIKKAGALKEEFEFRSRTVEEMLDRFLPAHANTVIAHGNGLKLLAIIDRDLKLGFPLVQPIVS